MSKSLEVTRCGHDLPYVVKKCKTRIDGQGGGTGTSRGGPESEDTEG